MMDMFEEEDLDRTWSELVEQSEDKKLAAEIEEDISEDLKEYRDMMSIVGATVILAEAFEDDVITLREYLTIADYIEDRERNIDLSLM